MFQSQARAGWAASLVSAAVHRGSSHFRGGTGFAPRRFGGTSAFAMSSVEVPATPFEFVSDAAPDRPTHPVLASAAPESSTGAPFLCGGAQVAMGSSRSRPTVTVAENPVAGRVRRAVQ